MKGEKGKQTTTVLGRETTSRRVGNAGLAGYVATPWNSRHMLWRYLMAVMEGCLAVACLHSTLSRLLLFEEDFLERVILVLHMVYETVRLSAPLVNWHTGADLARYFNEWNLLQVANLLALPAPALPGFAQ
jgi:hypothetical protein